MKTVMIFKVICSLITTMALYALLLLLTSPFLHHLFVIFILPGALRMFENLFVVASSASASLMWRTAWMNGRARRMTTMTHTHTMSGVCCVVAIVLTSINRQKCSPYSQDRLQQLCLCVFFLPVDIQHTRCPS